MKKLAIVMILLMVLGCPALAQSAEQNGITLTLDGAAFDGRDMRFGWTVSSGLEQPVYCAAFYEFDDGGVAAKQKVGGELGGYAAPGVGGFDDLLVVNAGGSASAYAGNVYDNKLPKKPVAVRVTVKCFTSAWAPLALGEEDMQLDDEALYARLSGNRQIGIYDGVARLSRYPDVQAALEADPALQQPDADLEAAYERALASAGLLSAAAELTVTGTIGPP